MYERRGAIDLKLVAHPVQKLAVLDGLKEGYLSQQIAGRMTLERHPFRVSPERSIGSPVLRTADRRNSGASCQSTGSVAVSSKV